MQRRTILGGMVAVTGILIAIGLSRGTDAPSAIAPVAQAVPDPPQLSDFEQYARRLENSDNLYYGTTQLQPLLASLRSTDPKVLLSAHFELGQYFLRFSRIEESVDHLQKALALAPSNADKALVLEQIVAAHLKEGELANCAAQHGPESCIVPLSAKAQHTQPHGSQSAIVALTQLLELRPNDAKARWLLTLAHMTLGTEAPEKWRVPLPPSEYDVGRFRNVAPQAGIAVINHAGGAAMDDFDGDGLKDIVTSDSEPSSVMHFFRNDGDGKFTDRPIKGQLGGLNLNHADYDNDGWLDVLVLRGGWMQKDGNVRVSLLRNHGGNFEDVTELVGLADVILPTQNASWGDYDNDGDLDLFIGTEGGLSRLYRNDRDHFINVTEHAFDPYRLRQRSVWAPADDGSQNPNLPRGFAKGSTWGDYDNDGYLDLYVSNFGEQNRLYHNNRNGTFTDVAADLGVGNPVASFSCWFFDYDNDGWLDLFVAGYPRESRETAKDMLGWPTAGERPRLYHNVKGRFEDVTKPMGLWHVWQTMGANFGDLDNDGLLDMYLGTGFPDFNSLVPNVMLRNSGKKFQDVTTAGGFGHVQKGHGIAFGDIDNDGDEDVFIQIGGFYPGDGFRNALFLNPGNHNHSLGLRFVGRESNRFGLGARVTVTAGTRKIHRVVSSGGSFGDASFELHVGLGSEMASSVEVLWPGTKTPQVFGQVPTDAVLEIQQGDPTFRVLARPHVRLGE